MRTAAPNGGQRDAQQGAGDVPGPRDRDTTGRPRNARPRDGLGRPLARSAAGEPTIDDTDLHPEPARALSLAQELLDSGRPFHAHEVLEAMWKAAPESERGMWKGLAQLAVGLTHLRRGNAAGAVALLRRGAGAVSEFAGTTSITIDSAGIGAAARALADRVEQAGVNSVPTAEATLRLTPL